MSSYYDELRIEAELLGDDPVETVTGVPADRMRTGKCPLCGKLECCRHSHSREWCEC